MNKGNETIADGSLPRLLETMTERLKPEAAYYWPEGGDRGGKPQKFSAKPPRKEKQIDPDNPFAAAIMGLKDGK